MTQRKFFGTDGIRGKVGEFPITPDFVVKLGWAAGKVLANGKGRRRVIIGKDTRISGYLLESALEAGLSAAGVDVQLLGPMPTPAIAYLTRTLHADAGIVISASHNPYYDNGIKFFSATGSKLPDEMEMAIERELEKPLVTVSSELLGKAFRIEDAPGRYIEFCKSSIPFDVNFSGLKIVVDSAHGATYHIAANVFKELGAEVMAIGNQPNGLNINAHCGSTSPQALQQRVIETQADLGIAIDGDGDRVIMVDEAGELVDGDEILFIIAKHLHQTGALQGGVVGTVMSNLGLEQALKQMGIEFARSKVGDRYVVSELHKRGWALGGESSGHILYLRTNTTGDGIIAAIQVVYAMLQQQQKLHQLKSGMKKLPQILINIPMQKPQDVTTHPEVKQAIENAEKQLKQQGRVLLRLSGTEPLVRVMVEGNDHNQVKQVAQELADVVRVIVG